MRAKFNINVRSTSSCLVGQCVNFGHCCLTISTFRYGYVPFFAWSLWKIAQTIASGQLLLLTLKYGTWVKQGQKVAFLSPFASKMITVPPPPSLSPTETRQSQTPVWSWRIVLISELCSNPLIVLALKYYPQQLRRWKITCPFLHLFHTAVIDWL